MAQQADIRTAYSELLSALGFTAMARDVLTETDEGRMRHYAKVIRKNAPESMRPRLRVLLDKGGYQAGRISR